MIFAFVIGLLNTTDRKSFIGKQLKAKKNLSNAFHLFHQHHQAPPI